MLLGHLLSSDESSLAFKDNFEKFLFALFPISYIIGLAVALKWRILGGSITTFAMILLFILRIDILFVPIFSLALFPPAILCIIDGIRKRKVPH